MSLIVGQILLLIGEEPDLVPTPKATETWYPIPHTVLLDQVEETLQHNGLKIVNQAHALGHEGNRYFGLLEVRNGDNAHDFSLVVGVRNSHDQTFPAGLVIGSRVFLCDNLAFSGEIRICRKHTRWIERDLPQLVEVAVGRLSDQRHKQERELVPLHLVAAAMQRQTVPGCPPIKESDRPGPSSGMACTMRPRPLAPGIRPVSSVDTPVRSIRTADFDRKSRRAAVAGLARTVIDQPAIEPELVGAVR
jgi:hypothetical protein